MGFYFACLHPGTDGDPCAPTITAREYLAAMGDAQEALRGAWGRRCGRCRVPAGSIARGQPDVALHALTEVVRQTPGHAHAHCLLALVHLVRGEEALAVRHVELAFDLAQRRLAAARTLSEALRRQSELALIRMLLLRLRIKVGRADPAWSLLEEGRVPPRARRQDRAGGAGPGWSAG
jgi:hypothetical protein